MNRINRPNEAVLPAATRPQVANTGNRQRVDHLSKLTRVYPNTEPHGLPNTIREYKLGQNPGPSSKGHCYRNAVFQALLNTPMFVNFVRMHRRRREELGHCPVKRDCLSCAMASLASQYWMHEKKKETQQNIETACHQLWLTSLKAFWPKVTPAGRIGPLDTDMEFYSDTFLLNFLTEMRSQLEISPGEYQTFDKMFTVHTVRRWKCSGAFCSWISAPYKWDSSMHLSLAVQKPLAKTRQTPLLLGIQRALHATNKLAARRGSTTLTGKCGLCRSVAESYVEIVNLPEVLVIIRNIDELTPEDDPDIPFDETLNVKSLTSGRDDADNPKSYELISGVGELRSTRLVSRSCAFARGAEDIKDKWYCIMDEQVEAIDLETIEKLQRSKADGGLAGGGVKSLCPEIFIYRRGHYDNRSAVIDSLGVESPAFDADMLSKRRIVARAVNDIFTQRIGGGLLKFKIKISPADPDPQEKVEVDLKLAYELNGKHYGLKSQDGEDFIGFHLEPFGGDNLDPVNAKASPFEDRALDRALRRAKGIYHVTKAEAEEEIARHAAKQGLPYTHNPFNSVPDSEEMDVDTQKPYNFLNDERLTEIIAEGARQRKRKYPEKFEEEQRRMNRDRRDRGGNRGSRTPRGDGFNKNKKVRFHDSQSHHTQGSGRGRRDSKSRGRGSYRGRRGR